MNLFKLNYKVISNYLKILLINKYKIYFYNSIFILLKIIIKLVYYIVSKIFFIVIYWYY